MALLGSLLYGQTASARITGVVKDSTGAIVPGVAVVAKHEGTGVTYSTVTTDAGVYTFEAVPAGRYTISAELPGFKKFISTNNVVMANVATTISVTLEVGQVSEQVEVSESYERVQTSQSGNVGAVVNEKSIKELPLNGRNPLDLVALEPGVVVGANTGGGTHVFGARDRAVNITIDGIDANETSATSATSIPIRTNPDSLQEYRVVTTNAPAEFGRNSGAQTAMITKSGTNAFHGKLFWFHRNRVLNANDWNLNRLKFQDPANPDHSFDRRFLLRNQFGGSIGGPIIKDRTFFFFNVQIQRRVETLQQTNTVYTASARQGIFRFVPGGRNLPAGVAGASVDASGNPLVPVETYNVAANDPRRFGFDQDIMRWIGMTAPPNRFDTGDGLNTAGFSFLARRTDPERNFTIRIDHTFNQSHSLFGRYLFGKQDTVGDTTNDGAARFPGLPPIVSTFRTPRNLSIGLRSALTARTVNEFIVGGNFFRFDFRNPNPQFPNIPAWNLAGGVTDPLSNYFGNFRRIFTKQVNDNITHIRGAHTIRGGINFRFASHYDIRGSVAGLDIQPTVYLGGPVDQALYNIPATVNDRFDLPTVQSLINNLLGKVRRLDQAFVAVSDRQWGPGGSAFTIESRWPEYDFYIQDDWKLRPNLTINAGLRWEIKLSPRDDRNQLFAPDRPITVDSPASDTIRFVRRKLWNDQWRNVGPSIGAAWDPTNSGKMAVRGNYRLAFDSPVTFPFSSGVFPVVPGLTFGSINTAFGQATPGRPDGGRIRDGLPSLAPPSNITPASFFQPSPRGLLGLEVVDPNGLRTPRTHEWSLSIQRDLGAGFVFDIMYVGHAGRRLSGEFGANQVDIFSNGFLDAFRVLAAGQDHPLFDRLLQFHPSRRPGENGSEFARRFFASTINLGSVAGLANAINTTLVTVDGRTVNLPEAAGLSPFFFSRYPQFLGGLGVLDSKTMSNYHGMVVQVQRRFAQGLEFQASYVLSKSLDTASFDPTFTRLATGASQSASSSPYDPKNRRLNYARSDFDRRHVFLANGEWDLPFGPGRRYLSSGGVLGRLVGGWSATWILTLESGRPFTVYGGTNAFSSLVQSSADLTGSRDRIETHLDRTGFNGLPALLTPEQRMLFAIPAAGTLGTNGRNLLNTPKFSNLDMAIIKRTRITETKDIEFRTEFFNLTNTPSYGLPSSAVVTSPLFGRVLADNNRARIIQLALKFNF
jgi:hypothetical protein